VSSRGRVASTIRSPPSRLRHYAQVLYAKGPQSQTRGAMILQAYLHPEAAAATAASNAQGARRQLPWISILITPEAASNSNW